MGKAIGLEIRKVFGVKLTDEEKTNLATSMSKAKLCDEEVKEEKEEVKIEQIEVGPSSSRVGIVAWSVFLCRE